MAVYAHNVNRVTISGTCFTGGEIWSTGFWLGSATADAGDPAGSAIPIAGFWNTFFGNVAQAFSASYITQQVKVAQHKASDGKVDLTKVDFYDLSPTQAGGGGSSALPPQISLAATMTSQIQRGTAAKGRMYLPGINTQVTSSTGKISSSVINTHATAFKTFLDAVNASSSVPDSVVLVSKGNKVTDIGTGEVHYVLPKNALVTGLRIGDVYDTQRRRRNAMAETYTTKVLA